jgi:thioredoxin 1
MTVFHGVIAAALVLCVIVAVVAHFRAKAFERGQNSAVDDDEFEGTVGEEFPSSRAARSALIEITEDNFEDEMAKSDLPIVVEFSADWCSACRTQLPLMEQAASKFAGRARFFKVDHDTFNSLLVQCGVEKIPTNFFVNPKTRTQLVHVGVLKVDQIGAKLDELASASAKGIAIDADSPFGYLLDAH